jgi:hypothetical protein
MSGHLAIFVCDLLSGGAGRVIVNLSKGFAERGPAVRARGPVLEQLAEVRVVDLGGDTQSLADKLRLLILHKSLRRAARYGEPEFRFENMLQRTLGLYQSIQARRQSAGVHPS